jgi:hypothetical protein
MSNTNTVASAIYHLLGGNQFSFMTGAKGFVSSHNSLTFRIPKSNEKINSVRISLNENDTYDIEFMRIHGLKVRPIKKVNDIHLENLVEVFEQTTGLFTSF